MKPDEYYCYVKGYIEGLETARQLVVEPYTVPSDFKIELEIGRARGLLNMRKVCKIHQKPVDYVFKAYGTKVYLCDECFGLLDEKDVMERK